MHQWYEGVGIEYREDDGSGDGDDGGDGDDCGDGDDGDDAPV